MPSFHFELIFLIGLPGSGKSYLAKQLADCSPKGQIISTDAIRTKLFGNESIQGSWLLIWQQIQHQFCDAVEQISCGKISRAIYDATNVERRHREEAIALAHTTGFTKINGIWIMTPLSVCLERNRRRDRCVPEKVILYMDRCLQASPPDLKEGFDRLIYLKDREKTRLH